VSFQNIDMGAFSIIVSNKSFVFVNSFFSFCNYRNCCLEKKNSISDDMHINNQPFMVCKNCKFSISETIKFIAVSEK
jgi:hypothetical protein